METFQKLLVRNFYYWWKTSRNLKRWEKLDQAASLDVAYKVDKYIFKYEPLYVARADTPPFDERFVGFGMTRNTQVGVTIITLHSLFTLMAVRFAN